MKLTNIIIKLDSNFYSFISGVTVSISLDMFMQIFSGNTFPPDWFLLALGSFSTLISSFCWAVVSWQMSTLRELYGSAPPALNQSWEQFVLPQSQRLNRCVVMAVISLTLGLCLLPFRFWA